MLLNRLIGRAKLQPFTLSSETEYRAHEALAQSSVKYILNGVNEYKMKKKFNSDFTYKRGIAIGSAVDAMLTDKDKLESNLNIVPSKVPTGQLGACIKHMLKGDSLEEAFDKVGSKKYSIDDMREMIDKSPYYYAMLNILNKDKITIMEVDYETAVRMYNSLKSHPFTKFYCKESYWEGVESYTQLPIVFEYKGRKLKALLDKVIVDNNNMTVLPIDFKTTEHKTQNFVKPFRDLKYDIQGYWYTEACKQYFKGYKILPFVFVVESNSNQGCPLAYEMSKKTYRKAKRKVDSALDLYAWHLENGFDYDKYIIDNNGKLQI